MGNVTHVLPGIHPVIGVDAGGATVHQRAFAAAAAGAIDLANASPPVAARTPWAGQQVAAMAAARASKQPTSEFWRNS